MTPEEKAKLDELKAKEAAEAELTDEERAEMIKDFRDRKAAKKAEADAAAKKTEEAAKKKRSFL